MKQFKRDEKQKSNKLHLDKYYTPIILAKYCIDKTFKMLGRNNISEVIEPSAGNGSFSNQIKRCIAYDIEPENKNILKQDFLKLELAYKKGRLIIGNPPYGARNSLSVQFYKKSIQLADYIAFILPISQLNNIQQMYEFDLIHSEDLGKQIYSDREVHCCFNIYQRSISGKLNEKPNYKLKDVEIIEVRLSNKVVKDYDIKIKAWGGSSDLELNTLGEEIKEGDSYAKEFYIKIYNKKLRKPIFKLLKEVNWLEVYPMTATPNLLQWQVLKYIKDNIIGIK